MTTTDLEQIVITTLDDHEDDVCMSVSDPCTKVATWIVYYEWSCTCYPVMFLYCEQHGGVLKSFYNPQGRYHCSACDLPCRIVSMHRKGS